MNLILPHHGIYLTEGTLAKLEGLGSSISLPPDYCATIWHSFIHRVVCSSYYVPKQWKQSSEESIKKSLPS